MFGENIKRLRLSKGFGVNELSRISGVNASYISALERDEKNNPSVNILEKLAKAFDVDIKEVMKVTTNYKEHNKPDVLVNETESVYGAIDIDMSDIVNIPILGTVRAGVPMLATENIEGYFPTLKRFLCSDKHYFYLQVQGDSMNQEFKEGSLLLVEKTSCIENGQIGVILIDGLDATVKKVIQNENMITLIPCSNNSEHIPHMYDVVKDQIEIVGIVKQATKVY